MAGVEPLSATAAYTEFLLATACTQDLGVTYAAMTPCMRLMRGRGFAGPYALWVQTYAYPGLEETVRLLEQLLDAQADDTPAVRTAYRGAMRLGLAFFEAAFAPRD